MLRPDAGPPSPWPWRRPDGVVAVKQYPGGDGTIVRTALGRYTADLDADVAGLWYLRWYSTGTGTAAHAVEVLVRRAMV